MRRGEPQLEAYAHALPKRDGGPRLGRALAAVLLLGAAFVGCSGGLERTAVQEAPSGRNYGIGEYDQESVAALGREALEEFGYERIIAAAREAGFITTRRVTKTNPGDGRLLAMDGAAPAGEFMEVFSEYAVVAGVVSPVDSPLPGPGDVVAVGILVMGLIHAGFGAALLDRRAEWSKYKVCRDQYEADTKACNALPDTDKALKNRCHDSASQRLGKCGKSKGKDLNSPPLILR